MRVRVFGKVVILGVYVVFEGVLVFVGVVDRYVVADASIEATFEAPEARAALPEGPLPHVDVSSLRQDGRKLGLGSSAAVVVASLGAKTLCDHPELSDEMLAERICRPAVMAHRKAQGGGSGIDVVTSAFGGVQCCWLDDEEVKSRSHALPSGMHVSIFAAENSASTPHMLALVRDWAKSDPRNHRFLMDGLCEASKATAEASTIDEFVWALSRQRLFLVCIGNRSGAPIVPLLLRSIAEEALEDCVAVHPSGAGGGDIVLCMGQAENCEHWNAVMLESGFQRLDVQVGAPGVSRVPAFSSSENG